MKKVAMFMAIAGLILAVSGTAGADSVPFNAPGYTYTKVIDGGAVTLASASFSPDGMKIAYLDRGYGANSSTEEINNATYSVKLYDRATSSTTTLRSITRNGTQTGNYGFTTPYFSDDGAKVGWTRAYYDLVDDLEVCNLSTGEVTTYAPPSPNSPLRDAANSDFLGSYTNQWVAWDWHSVTGEADMYLYSASGANWTQGTNLTSSANYSEYEPDSNRAGNKILYWSGETGTEPIDTAHTLTDVSGTWTKDVGFTPITSCTWAFWSRDETKIGVSKYDSGGGYGKGDLYVYDSAGNFLFDLTGPGVGQGTDWQYFGFNFNVGNEYVFNSTADNTLGGRDIWVAVPEPATLVVLALGGVGMLLRRRRTARE